jgi:hypothetical protein
MTVWRVGMEAVVVNNHWINAITGGQAPAAEIGDVFVVLNVKRMSRDQSSLFGRAFGKRTVYLDIKGFDWVESTAFRPAVRDDAELIARIKQCKPVPTTPHEVRAQVYRSEPHLSSLTPVVAAARGATVSNSELVGLHGQRKLAPHHMTAEPVTHRDLSQHAVGNNSDLNGFPHGERYDAAQQ